MYSIFGKTVKKNFYFVHPNSILLCEKLEEILIFLTLLKTLWCRKFNELNTSRQKVLNIKLICKSIHW